MNGELHYVGVTHRIAGPAALERFRVNAEERRTLLNRLAHLAEGRMVLHTCERFEVYTTLLRGGEGAVLSCLADSFGRPVGRLARSVCTLRGVPVARHMIRVAAGLESRIVGEPHVLGQVKEAYLAATESGALDPTLSALGRAAIHAGKRVRHETSINRGVRSIVTVAIDHLERVLGSCRGGTMLVVGTGSLATDVAAALAGRRVERVLVASRHADRARELAHRVGGTELGLDCLPACIDRADAVVACTSAASFVVDSSTIRPRRTRELTVIDLGVPRNVDPAVAGLPNVRLTCLDELVSGEIPHEAGKREAGVVVNEELERFLLWHRQRRAAGQIAALARRAAVSEDRNTRAAKRMLHANIIRLKREMAA